MTEITGIRFEGRDAFFTSFRAGGDVGFYFELNLQCSGAVLVNLRTRGFPYMSKYENLVLRDGTMDNNMYGKDCVAGLTDAEIGTIGGLCDKLRFRNTGDWDAKYAPGSDFTGDDGFRPVDGLSDFGVK